MSAADPISDPDHEHVEIKVNNRPVLVPDETTGTEIKSLAGQNPSFELFEIRGENEIAIPDDKHITVHRGEEFIACPGLEPA